MKTFRAKAAFKAFAIHFLASATILLILYCSILQQWYPYPFGTLSSGWNLLLILALVDLTSGPLLTALFYNPHKTSRELALDLFLIALLQTGALIYGLFIISQARPVVLAFEVDRFTAVSLNQIELEDLRKAPAELRSPSWSGPQLIGTRMPRTGDETLRSIEMSLQGKEPSLRPDWWQDYEESRSLVKRQMKPLEKLHSRVDQKQKNIINKSAQNAALPLKEIFYLPLISQKFADQWIILLNDKASIIGYANIDGFQ